MITRVTMVPYTLYDLYPDVDADDANVTALTDVVASAGLFTLQLEDRLREAFPLAILERGEQWMVVSDQAEHGSIAREVSEAEHLINWLAASLRDDYGWWVRR